MRRLILVVLPSLFLSIPAFAQSLDELEAQVREVETAFAQSMADRDFAAFGQFLAEDTVFVGASVLRGKQAVLDAWQSFFKGTQAPFSWQPETVVVIASGDIAMSTGPVRNSDGEVFAHFHSTWRKNADGEWLIILDKGHRYCIEKNE